MDTTSALSARILSYLESCHAAYPDGTKLQEIVTEVRENKSSVNKELYELKRRGKVDHVRSTPPLWRFRSLSALSGTGAAQQTLLSPKGALSNQSECGAVPKAIKSQSEVTVDAATAAAAPVTDVSSMSSPAVCSALVALSDSSGAADRNVGSNVESLCRSTEQLSLTPEKGTSAETSSSDSVIRTKILDLLESASGLPVRTTRIFQELRITSKEANRILHCLLREGKVHKSDDTPPTWIMKSTVSREATADSGDNLKKSRNNTLSVQAFSTLNDALGKVGMIYSPTTQGTGFRIGSRYLMTAAHVLLGIIDDDDPSAPSSGNGDAAGRKMKKEELCQESVYVVFGFEKPCDPPRKYHFDTWFWIDEKLDVALLRLREDSNLNNEDFPGDLNALLDWRIRPARKETVYIVGHQGNKPKEIDMNGKAYLPEFTKLDEKLYQEVLQQQEYFFFYHTRLMDGSSGSPIFVSRGDSIKLIGIHLKSFPSAEAIHLEQQQNRGHRIRPFQGGVGMSAVRSTFINLYGEDSFKEIFTFNRTS